MVYLPINDHQTFHVPKLEVLYKLYGYGLCKGKKTAPK